MFCWFSAPSKLRRFIAKPAHHVGPREEDRNRDRLRRRILRGPAIDSDRITGLLIVVGQDGRELLQRQLYRQRFCPVREPAFGIERCILAVACRVAPVPASHRSARPACRRPAPSRPESRRPAARRRQTGSRERFRYLCVPGFQVPALEKSAIAARECARADSADRRALPEAVVDIRRAELRLVPARIGHRRTDGNSPRGGGNRVLGEGRRPAGEQRRRQDKPLYSHGLDSPWAEQDPSYRPPTEGSNLRPKRLRVLPAAIYS